jgi:hypothetical protein
MIQYKFANISIFYIIDVSEEEVRKDGTDLVLLAEQVSFNPKREWQKCGLEININKAGKSSFC